jgi:filamentous hemagglutinin
LNINTKTLSNVGGQLIQTGDGNQSLVATDQLDNTNGLIATNAANLVIETQHLINKSSGLTQTTNPTRPKSNTQARATLRLRPSFWTGKMATSSAMAR